MDLFNNNRIVQMRKILDLICFILFACIFITHTKATLTFLQPPTNNSTLTKATVYGTLSSCTTTELVPQLPRLSFAKYYDQGQYYSSCNNTGIISDGTVHLSWYSYSACTPSSDCCANSSCHTVEVSTLPFALNGWTMDGSNIVASGSGIISSGPYQTHLFTWEIVNPISSQLACTTPAGHEISAGSSTLIITDGPTCSGVHIEEYCPGLHFA